MSISRPSRLPTFLSLVLGLLLLVQHVAGAWQEIAAYTDCGSTMFKTEKILVNFDMETYWLNISVLGQFNGQVVDSDPNTNRYSTFLPPTLSWPELTIFSHSHHRSILPPKHDIFQFIRIL
jgi:hypothetical protein